MGVLPSDMLLRTCYSLKSATQDCHLTLPKGDPGQLLSMEKGQAGGAATLQPAVCDTTWDKMDEELNPSSHKTKHCCMHEAIF